MSEMFKVREGTVKTDCVVTGQDTTEIVAVLVNRPQKREVT